MSDPRRIALVTGANRGIGLEVARQLADAGMLVLFSARDIDAAKRACAHVPGATEAVQLDVTQEASVAALRDHVQRTQGRLDVLVNNAGIAIDQWVSAFDLGVDDFRKTLETNLTGALLCCQAFVPMMRAAGHGRVVNVSSELGSLTLETRFGKTIAYRTSKAALNALTRFMAAELRDTPDVKINAACPGWVKTDLGGPDALRTVEEGADTIVWLATLAADGPSGGLFRDRAPYPW